MSKHTKGPWTVFHKHKYDEWHVGLPCDPPSNMKVALCPNGVPGDSYEEQEANARLIASAPDLLAACQGPAEDVTPLEWLSALLHEVRDTNWAETTVDPQAAFTALDESERLLANLRAAVRKAEGDA